MSNDPGSRRAWLALGGYIAGADGLSPEEADELGRGGAGPDLSADDGIALILAAGASELPAESLAAVSHVDVALKIRCLLEIAHAVASDGMSEAEWGRFREVGARLLGGEKVEALARLAVAERDARRARSELLG